MEAACRVDRSKRFRRIAPNTFNLASFSLTKKQEMELAKRFACPSCFVLDSSLTISLSQEETKKAAPYGGGAKAAEEKESSL